MNSKIALWLLIMGLIFSGCANSGSKPGAEMPGKKPDEPFLKSTGNNIKVNANRMAEDLSGLDFGALPAIEKWSDDHKYMSLPNRLRFNVHNLGDSPIELASIQLSGLKSEEPSSPFDTCGMEFPGFKIKPGEIFADAICFFPTTQSTSQITVHYLDSNGNRLVSIPVQGTGRALKDYEAPPLGAMGEFTIKKFHPEKEVTIKGGKLLKNGIPYGLWKDGGLRAPGCSLAISGGGHIPNPAITAVGGTVRNTANVGINQGTTNDEINTGQFVTLVVEIVADAGVQCVLDSTFWRIGGSVLWDYQEDFRGSIASIQFDAQKSRMNPIQLYWKNTGTHTIFVDVTYTENGASKSATIQRDFIVETDMTDINRQMEDFYTWNHQGKVLLDHRSWHVNSGNGSCRSSEDFFTFHKGFLRMTDHWRLLFNYPVITAWDPGANPPPADPPSNHNGRSGTFNTAINAKPRMYDLNGNGRPVVDRCAGNAGVVRLKQFTNADRLAKEMEFGWHGEVHMAVGGDMQSISLSPKDPVFFKWHKTIDGVYDEYKAP